MPLKGSKKSKSPPIFSHEFIIQNHADIVSCVAMLLVLGLMVQATAPLASIFITLHHNTTSAEESQAISYSYGFRDAAAVFFYCLICIVIHALIQEYILDKITRKLHLSKTKNSKFNESGQLLIFTALSAAWAVNIVVKDQLLPQISALWQDYPEKHVEMSFMLKFFYIIQISYWIHCIPELYFQKVKKDDMYRRMQYTLLYLVFISAAYLLNFTHIGLVLLILKFIDEAVLHCCRMLYFVEKTSAANAGFRVWNTLFVVCRLTSIILAILTFHYGLPTNPSLPLDVSSGNFNTPVIRLNVLLAICLIQVWMMWNFINFHLRRRRELQPQISLSRRKHYERRYNKRARKEEADLKGKKSYEDVNDLPEVDQNTRRRR